MNHEVVDHMKSLMVKQPYSMTMSRHALNVQEMRVMFRIIEAIQGSLDYEKSAFEITNLGDTRITFPVKTLMLKGSNNHTVLRKALYSLVGKRITLLRRDQKGIVGETITNMIMVANHDFRGEHVTLTIYKEFMVELVALARNYSRYLVEVAFGSSSPNVMKFYQFVSHWRDKKQVVLRVDSLRKWLKIENKYGEPNKIKKRILEPAMRELKARADVWFSIASRIKDGRRMIGWNINIHTRAKLLAKEEGTKPKLLPANTADIEKLKDRLLAFNLGIRQAQRIAKEAIARGLKKEIYKLLYQVNVQVSDSKIRNKGAYTAKVINEQLQLS